MLKNKKTFAETLRSTRISRGYSQRKAGKIISKTSRTIRSMENGTATPPEAAQKMILSALRRSPVKPSDSKLRNTGRAHHVSWEKGRGWFMRITILHNNKQVGKRIKVRLKTRDLQEAIARRDVILSSYRVMGFKMPG